VGGRHLSGQVAIEVRYERLSAGTRGAFLLKSADGDPHQVSIVAPRLQGGALPADGHRIPFDDLTVDLQPGRDLVVPFDIKTGEVPRGTYGLQADVAVDGTAVPDAIQAEVRVR
jgi:hypothetical protein